MTPKEQADKIMQNLSHCESGGENIPTSLYGQVANAFIDEFLVNLIEGDHYCGDITNIYNYWVEVKDELNKE